MYFVLASSTVFAMFFERLSLCDVFVVSGIVDAIVYKDVSQDDGMLLLRTRRDGSLLLRLLFCIGGGGSVVLEF